MTSGPLHFHQSAIAKGDRRSARSATSPSAHGQLSGALDASSIFLSINPATISWQADTRSYFDTSLHLLFAARPESARQISAPSKTKSRLTKKRAATKHFENYGAFIFSGCNKVVG